MKRLLSILAVVLPVLALLLSLGVLNTQGVGKQPASPTSPATQAPLPPTPSPAPTKEAATATPGTQKAPAKGPVVLAYYVPYDATSWASLQKNAANLDYLGAQWVSVDACGNVGSRDDQTVRRFAESKGVTMLPSLLTGTGWLNHQLLAVPATTQHLVDEIARYVTDEGYKGIDLDFEGINDEDRGAYSDFVAKVAAALHARGKILTLAVPAKAQETFTGWSGPYDYAALGKSADYILLMTYDFHWQNSPDPGSIAPKDWVNNAAAYAASQMPSEKVLVGLAFYGYDWNVTQGGTAKALLYPQAAALAKQYGAMLRQDAATGSTVFKYTAHAGDARPTLPDVPSLDGHEVTVHSLPKCNLVPPPTPTPKPQPTPAPVQQREVWLEDAASAAAKLGVATANKVGGVGAWRLGQEDPGVWQYLSRYRGGK